MRYNHRKSGVAVSVSEGKVMDPHIWEPTEPTKARKGRSASTDESTSN